MRHLRFVVAVAVVLIAFSFPPPGLADSVALVSVSPASPSVNVGTSLTVDVNISNVTNLYGFELDLNFDPAALQATDVLEGAFLPSGGTTFFIPGAIDNNAGSVGFNADTLLSAIPGVNGVGTLLQFDFIATGVGTSFLNLGNVLALDSSGNEIASSITNASVTVAGTGTVPTPEPGVYILLIAAFCAFAFVALFKKGAHSRLT